MKKLHTKKRINNKKGISMVLAIALVAVLFLTTTSFLSIAMLQQNETGTSLNSRQAYVSSKSALDIAEDFLNDGKLTTTLPSTNGASSYYVFYYDSTGNAVANYFATAEAAKTWIKNNPGLTIIGNAYVKITNNGGDNYTITAVGNEEKYNNTNGGNTGDLSVNVEMKKELVEEKTPVKMTMYEKKLTLLGGGSGGGAPFLMFGDQASFSLLRSSIQDTINGSFNFRTLNQSYSDNGEIVYIPRVESSTTPISSFFPLVFDKAVKINSESGSRCKYTAYNNGIYLLGNYSGSDVKSGNGYANSTDVCLYTNARTYGAVFECKYLVVGGNMVCKPSSSSQTGLTLKYSGSDYTRDNGVVVYFTRDCTLQKFDNEGEASQPYSTITYPAGYYFIPIPDNNKGVDLFDQSTFDSKVKITDPSTDVHYKNLEGIDIYSAMLDSTGKLKNMHSAYEENAPSTASDAVSFLQSDGKIQMYNPRVCTTSRKESYYSGWDDYYIYCAPSEMPEGSSHEKFVDFYSGKEFNFLWYNVNPMEVNSKLKMCISSNNIVLSIGPDQGEKVYYNRNYKDVNQNEKYPYNFNQTNLPTSDFATSDGTIVKTSAGTNKIVQKDSSASFSVKPYQNETMFTLNVINDFEVVRKNGSTYTVKAGEYKDIPTYIDSFDPKKGLDLFSDKAKDYFESHDPGEDLGGGSGSGFSSFALGSSVDWVTDNSINTGVAEHKLVQSDKYIKFEASNGGTFSQDNTYKAKAISCKFGNTVYGNGATLQADVVNINAPSIESNGGKGLFFDTYSGYDATDGSRCVLQSPSGTVSGIMLRISRDGGTDLKLSNGMVKHLDQGYYYFKDQTTKFNILSADDWKSTTCYFTKDLETPFDSSDGMEIKTIEIIVVDSFEGKYF
ncbi:MAG: hypothetical protein ACI4HK_05860 [Ruminococcus sp.]